MRHGGEHSHGIPTRSPVAEMRSLERRKQRSLSWIQFIACIAVDWPQVVGVLSEAQADRYRAISTCLSKALPIQGWNQVCLNIGTCLSNNDESGNSGNSSAVRRF